MRKTVLIHDSWTKRKKRAQVVAETRNPHLFITRPFLDRGFSKSGYVLSHDLTGYKLGYFRRKRTAELVAAISAAIPVKWDSRTPSGIVNSSRKLPIELRRWLNSITEIRPVEVR